MTFCKKLLISFENYSNIDNNIIFVKYEVGFMREVTYDSLMNNIKNYIDDEKSLDMISRAFWCANRLHEGQKRQSGEDYIVHPLSVAFILSEMKADTDTICAALLHDTIEDTSMSKEKIAVQFNETIATLVDGVTKISKMNFSSRDEQVATNTRKIITSLEEDVRIVIIKLADRLHNMLTLEYKSEFKQKENALETMEIFSPLAYYLGAYQIKSELEDLSLYYLRRDVYDNIDKVLEEIREDMEIYLKYARVAYVQMLKDVLPSSDYVIDGTKELEEKVEEIRKIILAL